MTPTTTHIELYRRADVPDPTEHRIGALREELAALAADREWTFGLTRWPSHVDIEAGAKSAVEHVYETFQTWARRQDVSLDPAFERRRCFSWETDERYEALITPVACFSVTIDGDLTDVYPHRDGGHVYTIVDGIERLRTDWFDDERLDDAVVVEASTKLTP